MKLKSLHKLLDIQIFIKIIYLRQLKAHELVECINPDVKKGKLYGLY